ncbi:hypothetical protein AHAS_Ahas19G0134800 [Arachis hypogaea]
MKLSNWRVPEPGAIKLNCDGSVKLFIGNADFGWRLRNNSGNWVMGVYLALEEIELVSSSPKDVYFGKKNTEGGYLQKALRRSNQHRVMNRVDVMTVGH